ADFAPRFRRTVHAPLDPVARLVGDVRPGQLRGVRRDQSGFQVWRRGNGRRFVADFGDGGVGVGGVAGVVERADAVLVRLARDDVGVAEGRRVGRRGADDGPGVGALNAALDAVALLAR